MDIEIEMVGMSRVLLKVAGKAVGALDVPRDIQVEAAARLGDNTPAAIRDRCYALVQNMAEFQSGSVPDDLASLGTFENEAYAIAKDAGWVK